MKTRLLSYALLGVLSIGASGFAVFAQTEPSTTQPSAGAQTMEPAIKGSIPLTQDPMAQYLTLAKVSMADAVTAAQKAVGTTEAATSASLEDENGYLVWAVIVAGQEVKIDAGTAEVLAQAAANADEMDNGNEQGGNEMNNEHGGNEHGGNGEMNHGDEQGGAENSGENNGDMNGEQGNGNSENGNENGGEGN